MRAYDCAVLLRATTFGYHWHGHGWTGSRSNSDEPQVEKQLPNTQPRNEIRNQGDFSAAILSAAPAQSFNQRSFDSGGNVPSLG
jgi:hypothetical protein